MRDELIGMHEGVSPLKRCRGRLTVKLIDSVCIPGDSMMFIAAKMERKIS